MVEDDIAHPCNSAAIDLRIFLPDITRNFFHSFTYALDISQHSIVDQIILYELLESKFFGISKDSQSTFKNILQIELLLTRHKRHLALRRV
jgi:hypothetical protein